MSQEHFESTDFSTVTFLAASGVPMAGVHRNGRSLVFVFEQPQRCCRLEDDLMFGDDNISARRLLAAVKHIRRVIRENV